MSAAPLVSVLIPCYNVQPYLAACLDSVLAQTYAHTEIICVNDGSRDGTLGVLREYEQRHGITVIDQTNAGQSAAFNRAYEACRGDYISFFDSDDLLSPDKISAQMEQVFRGGEVHDLMATCAWGRFFADPREADAMTEYPLFQTMPPVDWLVAAWGGHLMMHGATWLIPRKVLDRSGLWNETTSLINDHEFFCRVMLACREIVFVPGARTYYRSAVPNNLSGQRTRQAWASAWFAMTESTRNLLAVEDSPRTRLACARKLQRFAYEAYPDAPDLVTAAEVMVRELGGSDLSPAIGGRAINGLAGVIGWRPAKRLRTMMMRWKSKVGS